MVDTVVVQGHEMALVCVVDVQLQLGFDESQVRVRVEVYSLSQTSSGHWDHCDQELQQNGVVAGVGIVYKRSITFTRYATHDILTNEFYTSTKS